jgi:hypothetical protein
VYVARISENAIAREYGFAYFAGYTSGGAPYGITQKELDESVLAQQREQEVESSSRMRSPVVFDGPDNPFRTGWDEYTFDESWQGCEEPFELDCGDWPMLLEVQEHELLWQDSGCDDSDITWQEMGEVVTATSREEFKGDPFQLTWQVAEELPFSAPWGELREPPFSISWNELSEERP